MQTALEFALQLVDNATGPLRQSMRKSEQAVVSLDSRMGTLSRTVTALGAAFGGWQAAQLAGEIINLADKYTLLENRLSLVTTSSENLAKTESDLYQLALDTHGAYEATVGMYTRFARATEDVGTSQGDLLTVTRAVNEAIIVSGASSHEADAAIIQLSQGLASGVLRGQELNSVLEQTPRIAKMIADGLGITIGELRQYGKEGKLTTEAVIGALKQEAATVHDEFGLMSTTVGQAWQDVKTVFAAIITDGTDAASVTDTLAGEIENLAGYLDEHREDIKDFFIHGVDGVKQFWDTAGPVLQDTWSGVQRIVDGYNSLDPTIKEIGILMAVIGGKKGVAALAAVAAAKSAGKDLSDAMLDLMGIAHDDGWSGTAGNFSAAAGVIKDLASEVNGLESFYVDLNGEMGVSGKVAKATAKEACDAHKKQLTCAEKALQKEVKAAVASGQKMKDFWQIQAEDKLDVLSRSYQAQIDLDKATNDAIASDVEDLMGDYSDLWEGATEEVSELQEMMVNDLGQIFDGYINNILTGEINTIGDLFEGLFDSIIDMFSRMLSQFAANSIIDAIFGAGASGGLTLGGAFSALTGGGGLLGTAGTVGSAASGASTAAGWLGIGGQATIAPYVSGAGVALGAGGAVAGAGGAIGGMASFGLPQAGSIAAGASAAGAGGAGASAGMGAAAAGLGTALAFAAAPIAINLIGSLFDKEHPSWTIPTSSGRDLKVTKVTDDPLVDVHKALERTAFFAGDAALKLKQYNSSLNDSEYASEYAEEAQRNFAAQLDSTWAYIEYLGNDVGEAWAAAALRIDGSIGSIDSFVDAAAGFDVAVDTSASMWDLATSAAKGNVEAIGALEQQFKALGLGASAADEATMAMVGAVNQLSKTKLDLNAKATLDVEVRGDAHATASVTGASNVSSEFWWARGGGEDTGWGPNITSGGIVGHAVGGVFTEPTLIGRHLFGEAGPEILAPLPGGPNAFAEMAESIKKLVAGQNKGEIVIHLHNYVAGKHVDDVIIPVVDKHVADREARGVTGRVAYAVG